MEGDRFFFYLNKKQMVSEDKKKKNKGQKLQEKDLASRYFERGKKKPPQNVIQLNRKIMI